MKPQSFADLSALLPALQAELAHQACVVLQAPPGTGKTTRVPLALLDAPWLRHQKIILLEPRRLAARSAARYMAQLLGQKLGQSVGYRVRQESVTGPETRLEVVTEGVFTRWLQADPALEGIGLVIFDEFHERSLQADLGLVLAREVQSALREDLRLLVMSATLDSQRLSHFLQAPVFSASGQAFPVSTRYVPLPANTRLSQHVARQVLSTLQQEPGSMLVFLPGAAEIRQVSEQLAAHLPADVQLAPLLGSLSPQAQDLAIQPAPPGQRKVVLATNVAETSLTIEGIRVVIDSGLARSPRFDPVSGMTELVTSQISRASATQRQGRAGRLEPGICLRLWHEADQARMLAEIPPEMLSADLAPLALELAQWGSADPHQLQWLDAPPAQPYAQALELLQRLGALDAMQRITAHGKALARLPLHPRLGHMILKARAESRALGGLACVLAALLEARDLLAGQTQAADLHLRLEALGGRRPARRREEIWQAARQIGKLLQLTPSCEPASALGYLIALAYPERLAQRRPGGEARFVLANGRGAWLPPTDALAQAPWLAVAQLDGNPREARIFQAAELDAETLETLTQSHSSWQTEVAFQVRTQSVQAREHLRYGALTLKSRELKNITPELLATALCDGVRQQGVNTLPWTPAQLQLRSRVAFLRTHTGLEASPWPALDDASLAASLETWLKPFLQGLKKLEAIDAQRLQQGLEYHIGYTLLPQLPELAPTHWPIPSGSRIRLEYTDTEVILAARLQELFGLLQTPRVLHDTVPMLIHLLSPAYRPVQVTRDLASFWRETYPAVKKELKGRYAKHYWPDDPLQAEAMRGTKKQNRR